jgi:hypothetical protein
MKLVRNLAVLLCLAFLGCAGGVPHSEPSGLQLTEKNINIVMAKSASAERGPLGISDQFIFDGKIFAYATFVWDDVNLSGGHQTIDVKWYSADKLVSTRSYTATFQRPPYHVWFPIAVTTIGVGKGKVEFYSQGRFLGSKTFEIITKEAAISPLFPKPMIEGPKTAPRKGPTNI